MDNSRSFKSSRKGILNILNNKSSDYVSRFYRKPATVLAVYRSLSGTCREIVNRLLNQEVESFYPLDNETARGHVSSAIQKLNEYHILVQTGPKYSLNPAFKESLVAGIGRGLPPMFRSLDQGSGMQVESTLNRDYNSFMEVYNFILENEIRREEDGPYTAGLNKTLKEILGKLNFQIKTSAKTQEKNISGFKFLVEPIHRQVNAIVLFYFDYLVSSRAQFGKAIQNDPDFEQNLMEFFCALNFLSPKVTYQFLPEVGRVHKDVVARVFSDLGSIGLFSSGPDKNSFQVSELLEGFLNHSFKTFDQFKTNVIVETDFKIYVYSDFKYVEHLISELNRPLRPGEAETGGADRRVAGRGPGQGRLRHRHQTQKGPRLLLPEHALLGPPAEPGGAPQGPRRVQRLRQTPQAPQKREPDAPAPRQHDRGGLHVVRRL